MLEFIQVYIVKEHSRPATSWNDLYNSSLCIQCSSTNININQTQSKDWVQLTLWSTS